MTSESFDTPEARDASATAALDEALARLDGLDRRPTAEHVPAFERIHTALTEALSTIDGA
ncbi:hypothetical protein GCM10023321_81340 [Pseudonocardia eucalypti]|uniref:Uncharacterized protein n=1 Tax=Pseudonocardia eucalypti TaxID=648755 RepID=A0ABP9RD60_9PSEU|nr:hypothetical protein [Pseudonocardia eucalypti]